MGSKGSNTTTTTSSANANAMNSYNNILSQAGNLAQNQYVPYTGQLVAPVNDQQYLGIGGINNYANYAQPFINMAANYQQQAAAPITSQDIQQYMDPFTNQVVNATQAQFNNANQQQLAGVKGNAAAQGALGGNREAVAESETVNQQQKAQAPVIAGLESQGYQTGLNTALTEQQNLANSAYGMANLGVTGQSAGMQGAQGQIGAGSLEQNTQQAYDQALYGQFMNQQAFPYQQLSWLAGIDTGVGSQMGGTSSTTGPPPSWLSQLLGAGTLGVGAYGAYNNSGGTKTSARGGAIRGYDAGGEVTPFSDNDGIFPSVPMAQKNSIPKPPSAGGQQGQGGGGLSGLMSLGKGLGNVASGFGNAFSSLALRRGGPVRGYDDGGGVEPAQQSNQFQGVASSPYAMGRGYIPTLQMAHSNSIPKAPGIPQNDTKQQMADIQAISKGLMSNGNSNKSSPQVNPTVDNAPGVTGLNYDSKGNPIPTPTFSDMGVVDDAWRGGGIRGYADGGAPDDRYPDPGSNPAWLGIDSPTEMPTPGNPYPGMFNDAVHAPVGLDTSNADWSNYGIVPNGVVSNGVPTPRSRGTTDPNFVDPEAGIPSPGNPPSQIPNDDQGVQVAGDSTSGLGITPRGLPRAAMSYGTPAATTVSEQHSDPHANLWPALMAAGLGMMASRSPFPGVAIGEGGLQGLSTYSNLSKNEQDQKLSQQKINMEAKRLQQLANEHSDTLKETRRQHDIAEAKERTIQTLLGPKTVKPLPNGTYQDVVTGEIYGKPNDGSSPASPSTTQPSGQLPNSSAQPAEPPSEKTMTKAIEGGLHGKEFLGAVPNQLRATIEAVGNYDAPINVASQRSGMNQAQLLSLVRQFNPEYDMYSAAGHGASIKEFMAGGPSSPAAQITAANTAIGHAGHAWEAIQELKAQPGFMQGLANSGLPFASYVAARVNNAAIRGTPEGVALNKYITAETLYGAEVAKLYSGSTGSQEERNTVRAPLDPNLSLPEIEGGMRQSISMLGSRTGSLEDRYKSAYNAPGLVQYGTKGEFKQFPVIHDEARKVLDMIGKESPKPTNNPNPIQIQNGKKFQKQPDGSMKYIGDVS